VTFEFFEDENKIWYLIIDSNEFEHQINCENIEEFKGIEKQKL
jgi:hypothetical protein